MASKASNKDPSKASSTARPSKALIKAIGRADLDRLRTVLHHICQNSEEANESVEEDLLMTDLYVGKSGRMKVKRQFSRYEECLRCRSEFDVTENDDLACTYHYGKAPPKIFVLRRLIWLQAALTFGTTFGLTMTRMFMAPSTRTR